MGYAKWVKEFKTIILQQNLAKVWNVKLRSILSTFDNLQGMEHAKRKPSGVVLVLNVEISSVGFRGHVHNTCNKLSWLINSLLFADAASAVCILGSSFARECGTNDQLSNIRMVQYNRNGR